MPSPRSLLERIEHPDPADRRELPGDVDQLVDSIRQHLLIMLNTRHGGSFTVPDFGTSDFSDVSRGYESVQKMQDDIRSSIEKYEPRLTDIDVRFVPDEDKPFTMHFDIVAKVVTDHGVTPTVFHSIVETSGEVKLSRRG